jgi:hypothetical protein
MKNRMISSVAFGLEGQFGLPLLSLSLSLSLFLFLCLLFVVKLMEMRGRKKGLESVTACYGKFLSSLDEKTDEKFLQVLESSKLLTNLKNVLQCVLSIIGYAR